MVHIKKSLMFKNPFSFNGRIRRTEYGLSYLIYTAVGLPFDLYFDSTEEPSLALSICFLIILIPLLWFLFAQGAKRCHDRGNSGWFQLIPFYIFWLVFADSDNGENEYGPNPKGIGNHGFIDEIGRKDY